MFQKGVSHIEAILSFILFAGFIFVGLYFFTPTGNTNVAESTLKYTLNEISANVSFEMQTYSVKIYPANIPPQNNGVVAISFPSEVVTLPSEYKVRAENYSGSVRPATKVGNVIYVRPAGADFIILKLGEDFNEGPAVTERPASDPAQYKIASSSTRKVISEKRMLELNRTYYSSYEALKNQLDIPGQSTFAFGLQLPTYLISAATPTPPGVEVFSTITRREVISQSGDSAYAELNVRIW